MVGSGGVTTGEGGGDVVDGVTRLWGTPAAVAVTETGRSQTCRVLPGLSSGKHKAKSDPEPTNTGELRWDSKRQSVWSHLCKQPLAPIGPSGQRSHFSPVTPSLQLQRPRLSHVALTEPGRRTGRGL